MPADAPHDQLGAFQDRLNRLNAGAAPRNVIWVGADEAYALPGQQRRSPRTKRQRLAGWLSLQFRRALALSLGFAGYGAAMVARYQMGGLADPVANPDIEMGIRFASAFLLATIVGRLLGIRFTALIYWKALGAAAGVTLFHDLVHLYPHFFALAAPQWTQDLLANSKPATLFWRGDYLPLL